VATALVVSEPVVEGSVRLWQEYAALERPLADEAEPYGAEQAGDIES
jgi:hypothetical protein